jgi:hypothetical protein
MEYPLNLSVNGRILLMKNAICTIAFVIVFLSLFSCGVIKVKGEAQKIAESLFQERINSGWFDSDRYYSDLFWKNTDKNTWSNIKHIVTQALGDLESYSLTSWEVQSKVNTNAISGTIVVLEYETIYKKGIGTETLTIHKPLMSDEFSILGHNFNSKHIQQVIDSGSEHLVSGDSA